jgi:hypothetical protein
MGNIIERMLLDSVCCVSSPPFFSSGYSNLSVERFKVQRAKKTTARIRWNFPSITIPPSVRPSTARLIKAHNFFFPSTQMSSNPFFFILSFSSRVETRWKAPPSKNQSKQQQQQHKHVCDFHFWF